MSPVFRHPVHNPHETFRLGTSAISFNDPERMILAHVDFSRCNISEIAAFSVI